MVLALTRGQPALSGPIWAMPYTKAVRWYVTLYEALQNGDE